jgi:hypothetical protein
MVDHEGLNGVVDLNKKEAKKAKFYIAPIMFATLVIVITAAYYIWPIQEVTVKGTPTLVNVPKDGVYRTSDVITWTFPEICQPTGKTTSDIIAVLKFRTDKGEAQIRTKVVSRDFHIPDTFPECIYDNPTSVYVDGTLGTGLYDFEITGCSERGTRSKCVTFTGPTNVRIERVSGNSTQSRS